MKKYSTSTSVNTFLFTWNPSRWKWESLDENIELVQNGGTATERWSCVSHKSIKPADRAFLIRLGSEPKGIFASGTIVSRPFLSKHWTGEDKDGYRVQIDFDVLLHPEKQPILTLDVLKNSGWQGQQWTPQSSGISIKPDIAQELEAVWFDFLATQNIRQNPFLHNESETEKTYNEGLACQIIQTRYERNQEARTKCIEHYGCLCSVCSFDFEKRFGDIGRGFIHVHHLNPVAGIGRQYDVNPVRDLRPVCPNCHAMLHKQNPPFTIEELKLRLI